MKLFFSLLLLLLTSILQLTASPWRVQQNGAELSVEAFKHYHYVSCTLTAPAEFLVIYDGVVSSAEISPLSRGIACQSTDSTLRFCIAKPGQYLVRINDNERLFLFVEKPAEEISGINIMSYKGVVADGSREITSIIQQAINACAKSGQTLVFPAGEYRCTQLRIPSHAHLHLQRGAVLKADASSTEPYESGDDVKTRRFIYIKDASDVRITGLGAIDGNGRALRDAFADKARMRLILAVNSSDLLLEGIMLRDPGSWNTQILLCHDVMIRNIKLMNDTELSNTDGFDPDASRNLTIENSFAYCSDDNVAIKTTGYSDYLGDVENINIRGCVFLTKKSSLKVGTETRGARMSNITFEDNDVLESDRGMALYISDGAALSDVRYLNNRFERWHPDSKRMMFQFVVNQRHEDSRLGSIRHVLIKDCTYKTPFPKAPEIKCPSKGVIEGVVFDNLTVEGEKIHTAEQIGLVLKNSEVIFK